jgi:hypothetical protein
MGIDKTFYIGQNTSRPILDVAFSRGGTLIDWSKAASGATSVTFTMAAIGTESTVFNPAAASTQPNGVLRYTFTAAQTNTAGRGRFVGKFVVTYTDSSTEILPTTDDLIIEVT